jgi:DNA-binding response OmpR family regulator
VESQCSGSTVAKPPSLRVLVVEDDKLASGALRLILELDGYDVRVTGNGLRALRVLKDFNPQMVIMDWRVSGLCGERLCGAIRRRRPTVPIIITSSSDEAFSSSVDVSARMRKPIDVRRLREVVAGRIEGSGQL